MDDRGRSSRRSWPTSLSWFRGSVARWPVIVSLVVVAVIGLVALTVVGLGGPPVPDQGVDRFDLDAVRVLAGGPGPSVLRTVEVSSGTQRGLFLRAGGDLRPHDMPVYPVELGWDSGRTVLLEPATGEKCSEPYLPMLRFDPDAYERMQRAMLRSDAIVATHEHFDHICGLTQSPHLEKLAPKALLTPEQLDGTAYMTGVDDRTRALVKPFAVDGPTAIAPGVVVLPVGGHTSGSLWVYVRTDVGQEWLFVGDTLWTAEALTEERTKPRVIGWVGGEDAALQGRLLRTLLDLRRDNPEVGILIAHDARQWESLIAAEVFEPL